MKELEVPYHTLQTEALMRFLDENYTFRRNIFSGEVEYIDRQNDREWKPLRKYDQNSITLHGGSVDAGESRARQHAHAAAHWQPGRRQEHLLSPASAATPR